MGLRASPADAGVRERPLLLIAVFLSPGVASVPLDLMR
jgi:hypothetical protein